MKQNLSLIITHNNFSKSSMVTLSISSFCLFLKLFFLYKVQTLSSPPLMEANHFTNIQFNRYGNFDLVKRHQRFPQFISHSNLSFGTQKTYQWSCRLLHILKKFVTEKNHTITITTHPRGELNKWGIVRNTFIYPYVLQSCVNTTQEFRHALPDGLMEVAHSRPHLILRSWRRPSDLICPECSLNLHKLENQKENS